MAVLHKASARRGGTRPRLWIDPNPSSPGFGSLSTPGLALSPGPISSLAASAADIDTATPTSAAAELFYVLCLYDYDAEDSDQLSFRRNDILDVVKKEDTGWWAAIHPDSNRVGWIPSAFVEPISDSLADKLMHSSSTVHVFQEDIDVKIQSSPDQFTDPFVVASDGEQRDYDWMSLVNGDKVPIMQMEPTPTPGVTSAFSPLAPPPEGIEVPFLEADPEPLSPTIITSRMRRRSRPLPLENPDDQGQVITLPPAPSEEMPVTPRTPGSGRRRSMSLPIGEMPSSDHQRSRSESTSAITMAKPPTRRARRRPLLIDDKSSLNRLTTLFEAHNLEELDHLIASPVVAESFDAFTRTNNRTKAARTDKVRQITGDDEAQALHDAQVIQGTWYLRPLYGEGEILLQHDGAVSAGTLRALVERLTLEFPKPSQEFRYRQAFLMTHKSFATADEVLDLLFEQFQITPPAGLGTSELDQWKEKRLRPTRRRILTVLKLWNDDYGLLQDDHHLAPRLVNFLSAITSPLPLANAARDVLKSLERFISVIPGTPLSAPGNTRQHKKGKASKGELLRMDTNQVAEHLCMQEQRLYSKIRPQECINWVQSPSGSGFKHLAAFNAFHEKLGSWVTMSILNFEGLGKRAEMIDFWIKVAEKSKALHNYASTHALVVALSAPVVARLHLTWAHVNRRAQLEQLAKYHEPTGNFSAYRLFQRSADGPCIPHIDMHLADMKLAHEQLPDSVRLSSATSPLGGAGSLINFAKRDRWLEPLDAILRHQARPYTVVEDLALTAFIETSVAAFAERDQSAFWAKSQEIQQAEMLHADIRKGLELAGF